jgi:hypothetical protein
MWKMAVVLSVVLVTAAMTASSSAFASGGGTRVIKRGSCSGNATWKLKAKIDGALIETEFEVDQNVVGRKWRVVIRQNGVERFRGIRTTQAPSGSFTVRRLLRNQPGSDRIVGKATALATGQVCRGALTI